MILYFIALRHVTSKKRCENAPHFRLLRQNLFF